jgi:RNA polymerase sigma factor (sigma-70 family)
VADARRAIEAVFRIESARVIARVARIVGDVGVAEELAQEALVAALETWERDGVPDNPGAWLVTAAKRKAIDIVRRRKMAEAKLETIGHEPKPEGDDIEAGIDDEIGDELLRLVFVACHPVLPVESRVALTLRLVGGLTTEEIARAFLVPEPTIQQRIVRAKRALGEAKVPFEVPRGDELRERLGSVLGVVYLIFNEGYAATSGEQWTRPELCEDALRVGRILAELAPGEAEVHGLVALMELQASRLAARIGKNGEPVLLADQNRARWDRLLIGRGLAALERARAAGPAGPYVLQAAIAACHARARVAEETDWAQIAGLYGALAVVQPSPIVELNRAVAVGMAEGPAAGLRVVDAIANDAKLAEYHLLPTVRADLLAKLGRVDEARAELERAEGLTRNEREKELLRERARKLGDK